jgi:cellulose synthase/poly-beta-1,6-N-acetylglucosamine synthase-like glycosyltransferase
MLSILIPSYNHAAFVEEAIASARKIDVPGKRIIVIDDASPDGSADVIERYLQREGREGIEFIRKPVNKGVIDSVITFLSMCETPYVYMMASDDVVLASGIEVLVDRMEADPELQFVVGGGLNAFPDGTFTPVYTRKHVRLFSLQHDELLRSLFLADNSPLLCQSSVFRLSAIRDVGGFDPAVVADDYALFARLFTRYGTRGRDFDFLPEVNCVHYRHHGSNSYHNLLRQALSHRQVVNVSAPPALRTRAAGYKLAYFALISIKRADLKSLLQILRHATVAESPWLAVGMFANTYHWLKNR